ncbi:MAG: tetratricopeptide repeat protein [Bacteroidetes bacterium]|nr:tetratricopeptide repeat protein [Bacteroidota bacterium]
MAAIFLAASLFSNCKSGLITASNGCYNLIQTAKSQNKSGNYNDALNNFNTVLKKCDAYDAKEAGYAGKANALNGLGQYNDALDAANAGLKINNTSIDNLFAKATAELGLGMNKEAKSDLNTIAGLTQKNQNITERATIYAKMAEVDMKQQMYSSALQNIQAAISMDNSNLDFYMQRGDINAASGNLSEALSNYEEAIAKGKNDAEAWKSKTITLIKVYQKKYNTDNVDVLAKKLSSTEKQNLCNSIQTGQDKGMRDINIDLAQSSICK